MKKKLKAIAKVKLKVFFVYFRTQILLKSKNFIYFSNKDESDTEVNYNELKLEPTIDLDFHRLSFSKAQCFVCKKIFNKKNRSKTISINGIVQVFKKKKIVIKVGSRCCPEHLQSNKKRMLKPQCIEELFASIDKVTLKKSEIEKILSNVSKDSTLFDKFYNKSEVPDDLCKKITGLSPKNFEQLHDILVSSRLMRSSEVRSISQALAIYLFWFVFLFQVILNFDFYSDQISTLYRLKTGLDHATISVFFDLNSFKNVQKCCTQVRDSLTMCFVPHNLGAASKTREDFLKNNTELAKHLLEINSEQLILIADGTYLYCQKSFNNSIQRKTYSGQKKRHLVKPFLICLSNGFIIDAYGLYGGTKSDSDIIKHILKHETDLINLIRKNDVIILDRGFRDAVNELENKHGLITKMPTCSNKKQLTTKEANLTRFATKLRWPVEADNGLFKKHFKAVEKTTNNRLPQIIKDFKIAAALINRFHSRWYSDIGNEKEIVEKMKKKLNKPNNLDKYITNKKYVFKKKEFKEIDSVDINDFPKLSIEFIKSEITFGSYQIKMSKSYLAEHFKADGKYALYIKKDFKIEDNIKTIMCIIQSRHSNAAKYFTFIRYIAISEQSKSINSIEACENLDWACSCFSGLRTVGCCVHIATIIIFLSHYRHLKNLPNAPGYTLNENFLIDIDLSDSESEYDGEKSEPDSGSSDQPFIQTRAQIKNAV